jgi:hypothetical protein
VPRRFRFAATAVFVGIFLVHALDYSYFFVDDEAIPYVYAQNVLHGRGLVYSPSEGAVEAYSDFLQLWIAVAILGFVKLAGLNKLGVFLIGAFISLLSGIALLLVLQRLLTRLPGINPAGATAATAFLALSGPLALWSCSSIEATLFAFTITLLVASLMDTAGMHGRIATVSALGALLLRIDGAIYVGIILAAFLLVSDARQRRTLLTTVVLPALALLVVYHAWRWWYFGDLLPTPLVAKVLYKLQANRALVTKPPDENYLLAFLHLYGIVPLALFCLGWIPVRRDGRALALLLSAALMMVYLAIVGDWMFGFRFFLSVIPILALLGAYTISALAERWPRAAWMAVVVCLLWFGWVAVVFGARYTRATAREHWWRHPTLEPTLRFKPFYTLYERSRPYLQAGDLIAYNQAGFLPFMLDVDNIDDLGICTRFHAELPTTDVFFTEVGRYSPLTNKRVFDASQAYLLYRAPKMIFATRDLIRRANHETEPEGLLDNAYVRLFTDIGDEVAYVRRNGVPERFRTDPTAFLENVVHVSRLVRAEIDGQVIDPRRYQHDLRHLFEESRRFHIGAHHVQDLQFAHRDLPVYEIHLDTIYSTQPLSLRFALQSQGGGTVFDRFVTIPQNEAHPVHIDIPGGTMASRFTFEAMSLTPRSALVEISDLRVQGQPPELAAYVRSRLRFPVTASREKGEGRREN